MIVNRSKDERESVWRLGEIEVTLPDKYRYHLGTWS